MWGIKSNAVFKKKKEKLIVPHLQREDERKANRV